MPRNDIHPPPESPAEPVVLLRADATTNIGVGHAMRLLALAQEIRRRGHRVVIAGDLDVAWVAAAYAEAGIERLPAPSSPDELVRLARAEGATHCVLDRYDLTAEWGATLRAAGVSVMAMVDGEFSAHQDADLYIDQNPGATPRPVDAGRLALAGASYTLFRDDVLALRRDARVRTGVTASDPDPAVGAASPVRVLAVFGGTDPMGAAPVVTPLVVDALASLRAGNEDRHPTDVAHITVVTPDAGWADALRAAAPSGVEIAATGPVTDLARRAAASDLVVTASGSSVWELMCLGVPLAVVCVVDNQRPGYDVVVEDDLALGLGSLDALRSDEAARAAAVAGLTTTLQDTGVRTRRAARAQALLDGRGRERVADALLSLDR